MGEMFHKGSYKYNVIHKIIINNLDKKYFKFTWRDRLKRCIMKLLI